MVVHAAGSDARTPIAWHDLSPRLAPAPGGDTRQVTIRWRDTPIEQAARNLAATQGMEVLLDRRIDPSTPVSFAGRGEPRELLHAAISAHEWGFSSLAGVWYVGPAAAAAELQTVHARAIASLREAASLHRFVARAPLAWPRLSRPGDLVGALTRRLDPNGAAADPIPHDLWRAASWPAAPLGEQLSLLLVGFDLEWRSAPPGGRLRLAPIRRPVVVEAWHPATPGVGPSAALAAAPGARVEASRGRWLVTGTVQHHRAVAAVLAGRRPRGDRRGNPPRRAPATGDVTRYTLTVKDQPLGPLADQLAAAVGLRAEVDQAIDRDTRVSFAVREATLEQLVAQLSEASGLAVEIEGGLLRVRPR